MKILGYWSTARGRSARWADESVCRLLSSLVDVRLMTERMTKGEAEGYIKEITDST